MLLHMLLCADTQAAESRPPHSPVGVQHQRGQLTQPCQGIPGQPLDSQPVVAQAQALQGCQLPNLWGQGLQAIAPKVGRARFCCNLCLPQLLWHALQLLVAQADDACGSPCPCPILQVSQSRDFGEKLLAGRSLAPTPPHPQCKRMQLGAVGRYTQSRAVHAVKKPAVTLQMAAAARARLTVIVAAGKDWPGYGPDPLPCLLSLKAAILSRACAALSWTFCAAAA